MLFTTEGSKENRSLHVYLSLFDGSGGGQHRADAGQVVIRTVPNGIALVIRIEWRSTERVGLPKPTLPIVVRSNHDYLSLEQRVFAFNEAEHIARREHLPGYDRVMRMKLE